MTAFRLANVTLTNIPRLMVDFMKWYRRPAASGGSGKTKVTSNWASQYDYDRRGYIYYRDSLNCAYSTSNSLYTAATCGYPVGDLRWFPTRHASWLVDPCVQQALPVNEDPVLPTAFELAQNYPNPFNPTTRITYSVPTQSRVVLEVVNVLGQRVETLVNDVQPAGQHEVTFDASRLATGMYLYRLTSPSQTITRKMMLVK